MRPLAIACLIGLGAGTADYVAAQRPSPVTPLFDLTSPERGPFPSDRFTVADPAQNTGLRINLPLPGDCAVNASECEDRALLNQLDGFNMQPRISVPFSGEIDPSSVTGRTAFVLRLPATGAGERIGINHLVWDPATRELSGRPDVSLEQHTTYALVVTTGIRDARGNPIGVAPGFGARNADAYQQRVLSGAKQALAQIADAGGRVEIAAASVFTTQSFSHIIERMHAAVSRAPAPALNFGVGPDGARAVFAADAIESVTHNLEQRVNAPLTPQLQPPRAMRVVPGVGTVAFGTFRAPDFTVRPWGHIPPIPTRTGILAATGSIDTAFNLWLPAGARPANGWPVAIYGHGSFGSKNSAFAHAAVLNSRGIAVIAFTAVARGSGSRSTTTIGLKGGQTMTVAAPGLGYDENGDGQIADWEPHRTRRPYAVLNTSGAIAQAAAQTFALVRGIQAGADVDGNGAADLDGSRIYYLGQSLGAMWGMMAFAYEPAIRAAVFSVPAGTLSYNTAMSPLTRPDVGRLLEQRTPSLLNSAGGLTSLDGVQVSAPFFNENLPLRNQPPLVNRVPGAAAIQRVLDAMAWAAQFSNTVAIAPLLRARPPAGVTQRPFIVQIARSDQASVNPLASEIIRAGGFVDRVFLYQHGRNASDGVPANPHAFLSTLGQPDMQRVALGAQQQVASFFESDGRQANVPSPTELWEAASTASLPDNLFFLPRPR